MAKRAKPVPTIRSTPESPEAQLVAKLQRIEALHARARLAQLEGEEPPVEFRFTLADQWSRHLFVALMRRLRDPALSLQPTATNHGDGAAEQQLCE